MTFRLTIVFSILYCLSTSLYGQSKKSNTHDLKGATSEDYYVTVKLVDKEPTYKPTYLLASKPNKKQKKWDLDTVKINIDKYFLRNESIHGVGFFGADCACDLPIDTTGNGVCFILLKPSAKLLPISKLLEKADISLDSLDKLEIFINGKQLTDNTILIDSEAEVYPVYRKGEAVSKNNIISVAIWTLTKEQRKKYGM